MTANGNFQEMWEKTFHRQERKSYRTHGNGTSQQDLVLREIKCNRVVLRVVLAVEGGRSSIGAWVATRTIYSEDVKMKKKNESKSRVGSDI